MRQTQYTFSFFLEEEGDEEGSKPPLPDSTPLPPGFPRRLVLAEGLTTVGGLDTVTAADFLLLLPVR